MSLELPVLRLGLAGFTVEQQQSLEALLEGASVGGMTWQVGKFEEADAWCVNGARSQLLTDGTLRVASGVPAGRSVHLNMPEIDRPVAFALPLAPRNFEPTYSFDATQAASVQQLLGRLESWLRPLVAQFCLASQILEHETALGSGVYHVSGTNGALLAVVNLRGDVGVLPTASPLEFEHAMWNPRPPSADQIPEGFVRTSLSQLMWQYAIRTTRDVLPRRYRTGVLYFRRPPRLPQRLLRDSHLLLLRELAGGPGTFAELAQRTGLTDEPLAQDLAALYLVGAITSNPKRAQQAGVRRPDADSTHGLSHSVAPSGLELETSPGRMRRPRPHDLTAPAPLTRE